MLSINKKRLDFSGTSSSCNFCSRGTLIEKGAGLKYPYRTVYEIRGNSLLVTLCPECFKQIKLYKE